MPLTNYLQLYFIRHGQSENNLLLATTGAENGRSSDPELTATGRKQAHQLGDLIRARDAGGLSTGWDDQNLGGYGFTHLYSSLMVRAAATGTILSDALGLTLRAWEEVHETGGIFLEDAQTGERVGLAGKPRSYFEQAYPRLAIPDRLDESGWWNRPFEEEPGRMERARRFVRQLRERHGGSSDRVAVVSHGGFYNRMIAALLGLDQRLGLWHGLNNTGVSRFDFPDGEPVLVYSNALPHLTQDLIT